MYRNLNLMIVKCCKIFRSILSSVSRKAKIYNKLMEYGWTNQVGLILNRMELNKCMTFMMTIGVTKKSTKSIVAIQQPKANFKAKRELNSQNFPFESAIMC